MELTGVMESAPGAIRGKSAWLTPTWQRVPSTRYCVAPIPLRHAPNVHKDMVRNGAMETVRGVMNMTCA